MAAEKLDRIMVYIDPDLSKKFKHKLVDTEMSMSEAIRTMIVSFCSISSNDAKNIFCEVFSDDAKKQENTNA